MEIAYIGNFRPPHSTENHVVQALGDLGHRVTLLQEDTPATWGEGPSRYDFILWTRTGWNPQAWGWSQERYDDERRIFMARCSEAGTPVVGFHLDRWWGLTRQAQITDERDPFFEVDLLVTADGGHDATWDRYGINHAWLPPAVARRECVPGEWTSRFAADVAFVGSWQGYHPEDRHRFDLVDHLQRRGDCRFWPEPGEQAIRGHDLRNLYATTLVNVGDSCLIGGITRYCSDRIPETLGRGGFLLHPFVEGITDGTVVEDGKHLICWERGDFDDLDRKIAEWTSDDSGRREIAERGRSHVLDHHTYDDRMRTVTAMAGELMEKAA